MCNEGLADVLHGGVLGGNFGEGWAYSSSSCVRMVERCSYCCLGGGREERRGERASQETWTGRLEL